MKQCKICNEQFAKECLLKSHITRKHKETTVAQYIVDYEYDRIWPLCKCNCGKKLRYFPGKFGFGKYLRGHQQRIFNQWGHNKKAQEKSANTRRKRFKSGEIHIWNKGVKQTDDTEYGKIIRAATEKMNTPERGKKISSALKGREFSEEHIKNIGIKSKEYWSKEENRDAQRDRQITFLINHHKHYTSKLETFFENKILKLLDVLYEKNYYAKNIKAFYDFYLPDYNMLIETDGDFWHCNMEKKYEPKYQCQFDNLKRDEEKNKWAKENGYKLLRFWEHDIKNNKQDVVLKLLTEIKNVTTTNINQ